jgi:hypothetical protein
MPVCLILSDSGNSKVKIRCVSSLMYAPPSIRASVPRPPARFCAGGVLRMCTDCWVPGWVRTTIHASQNRITAVPRGRRIVAVHFDPNGELRAQKVAKAGSRKGFEPPFTPLRIASLLGIVIGSVTGLRQVCQCWCLCGEQALRIQVPVHRCAVACATGMQLNSSTAVGDELRTLSPVAVQFLPNPVLYRDGQCPPPNRLRHHRAVRESQQFRAHICPTDAGLRVDSTDRSRCLGERSGILPNTCCSSAPSER